MVARPAPVIIATCLALCVLSGCSSANENGILRPGGPDGSSATAIPVIPGLSVADIQFAQAMLPHHVQGVELASLALQTVTDPEVRAIAERIIETQSAEREFLTTWLGGVSPEMRDAHAHTAMTGMLTTAQMQNFATLSGPQARDEFLRLMTLHHQGAITMANLRLTQTGSGTMTTFARSVIAEQSAEIARMRSLQLSR